MKFLAPSSTTSCSMRDGHKYDFTKNRIKAPAYGNANRTVGQSVDVTCQSCIEDFQEPRHGFASRVEDVEPTISEQDWLTGRAQKQRTTIQALQEQLAALADEQGE